MGRTVGTTIRGIRAPIVQEGDNLVEIVVNSVLASAEADGYRINDKDVIGVTESLLARAQGNYASIDAIALDVKRKFKGDVAVLFPLLSRNRFAPILRGIARSERMVYLYLSYPSDEVGNHLMDVDRMYEVGINPHTDVLTEARYRELFGPHVAHPYTGNDYVSIYRNLAVNNNIRIFLTNNPRVALDHVREVIVANVHERHRTKRILRQFGAETVYGLDDLLTEPINGSGYNPEYGLLGSNQAGEERIKLFPRDSQRFVNEVQQAFYNRTGKRVEVLVYGDGAFKDPTGRIWELADPVVSPGYTAGLEGTPREIKLKYVADNEFNGLEGEAMAAAIRKRIQEKEKLPPGTAEMLGTTPRHIPDLLGSLCDLTSGSGDKGTPIVLIQGYFDSYADM